MKSSVALAFCSFLTLMGSASGITTLIGNGINNGFYTNTSNPTSATGDAITTNANGRALISSSTINDSIEIANWTATREGYLGGNAAFGWDGASAGGSPRSVGSIPYAFVNGGEVLFTADPVSFAFMAGDTLNLDFGTYTETARAEHVVSATLTLSSGEVFMADHFASPASGGQAFFNQDFVLTQPAASATLTLLMQSDRTDSDGDGRRNGQFTLDNISLRVVPEPSRTLLSALGFCLVAFRRRR